MIAKRTEDGIGTELRALREALPGIYFCAGCAGWLEDI